MDSFRDHSSSTVDADDNAFYQELTRQILMLTDEDDDHKGVCSNDDQAELWRRPVVYGGDGSRQLVASRNYYSWSETGKSSVPRWMESLWANGGGGGTGVFIPSGAPTAGRHGKKSGRRRNNKATKNNGRTKVVYSTTGQKIHG